MNIWGLRYFYEAAKNNSVAAAADKYLISNSAVSQSIKNLENEFGVQLLHHRKRFFELTEEGQVLFEKIPELMNQIDSLKDHVQRPAEMLTGTVQFGIPRSLLNIQLAQAVLKMKKKFPLLKFKIKSGVTKEIKKMILNGDVDFGIVLDDQDLSAFEKLNLNKGEFILVSKSERAGVGSESIIVTDKEKVEVVHLSKELSRKKIDPNFEFEINSWTVIADMVKKTSLIGYVPDYVVRDDIEKLKLFKVNLGIKPYQYTSEVIWPKNRSLPKAAATLRQLYLE